MSSKYYICLFLALSASVLRSQIISQFTWDSNPILNAAVGPNATSAGANATSSTGGVGGTNGLNPGVPTIDINLTVPNTSNVFDVNSIDISIDYRRNESTATMFRRSTFNSNNGAANFRMLYRVATGTVITTVTSTNVNIPQDNTFRNYRFTYDNCSGIGNMYVNNVVAWTSPTATPGQNLYWAGDGNLIIGSDMDGAGNNIPNLDNFILRNFACSTLPIELTSFTGSRVEDKNILQWSTASESKNDYFTIEQSDNGMDWKPVKKVYGAGNSRERKNYQLLIERPEKIMNYYRLTQTDFNGETEKFGTVVINNSVQNKTTIVRVLDLLGREMNVSDPGVKIIYYSDGTVIKVLN